MKIVGELRIGITYSSAFTDTRLTSWKGKNESKPFWQNYTHILSITATLQGRSFAVQGDGGAEKAFHVKTQKFIPETS